MAKRQSVLKRNQTEDYLINEKYNGPEPSYDGPVSSEQLCDALNWYARMGTDVATARTYVETYLTEHHPLRLTEFKAVPDCWINYTTAHLMRIRMQGGILPKGSNEFIWNNLGKMLDRAVVDVTSVAAANNVVSIQDRIREKASDTVGEILGMIDDGVITPKWSLFNYATKNEWSGMLAKRVHDKLNPVAVELAQAVAGDIEGYKVTKELKTEAAIYKALVEDAARFAEGAAKTRKPRRKKVKPADVVVKKLNYAKEFETYKSVHPTKIVGAAELWTYNGKANVLTVYRARTRDGLTVKGSSIVEFDTGSSSAKKMGRKAKERIEKVMTGGKVALRKIMDEFIGTPIKKIGRINKDTVLLRVL